MKKNKKHLTDIDLQLYSAGVLPWHKVFLVWIVLFLNRELRQRLQGIKKDNQGFLNQEYPRLKNKLEQAVSKAWSAQSSVPISTETDNAFSFPLSIRLSWKLAAGLAFLLLLGIGIYLPSRFQDSLKGKAQYAAKGTSLGVHLFVKGLTTRRVENYSLQLSESDTLQVIPVGSEKQYLIIYGWDGKKGLTQIFPAAGQYADIVSKGRLPPAMVLDSIDNNKLFCITSLNRLESEKIRKLLFRKPFIPMKDAPTSFLDRDIYVQIYSIKGNRP